MADKAFIDTLVRLSTLYTEASKDMFPVKPYVYPRATDADFEKFYPNPVYGLDAYCNFPEKYYDEENSDGNVYKAIFRLHQVWEQALLRRLGEEKNVNGSRVYMLYLD